MKLIISICMCCTYILLCPAVSCSAKEWRGIVPLVSTRADVTKLLGEPKKNPDTGLEYFDRGDETVIVQWIDPTCERKYPVGPTEAVLPTHLVLSVSVFPKQPIPVSEFDLLPLTANGNCLSGSECSLQNDEQGISFTTSKRGVTKISYYPPAKELRTWLQIRKECLPSK